MVSSNTARSPDDNDQTEIKFCLDNSETIGPNKFFLFCIPHIWDYESMKNNIDNNSM